MINIEYIEGDATEPVGEGNKIIAHVVNDMGLWGKGFVLAVSKKWPDIRNDYLKWHNREYELPFWPGTVKLSNTDDPQIVVANMLAQSGVRKYNSDKTVLQYDMLANCLGIVAEYALVMNASVHMPLIGSGLAGGDWSKIAPLIKEHLILEGVPTNVYVFDDAGWAVVKR